MTQQIETIQTTTPNPELLLPFDALTRSMEEAEFRFNRTENYLKATFPSGQCYLDFTGKINERSLQLTVRYSILVPEDRRFELLNFMNAVNWRMALSNLEMDPKDGEIICRLSAPLDGGRITFEQADVAVHTVLRSASRHAEAILQMSFQNVSADRALVALDDKD